MNLSRKINYIIFISWISFIFSALFTIGIFSKAAMIGSTILGILIFVVFKKTQKDIIREEEREHELEMEKLKKMLETGADYFSKEV